MRNYRLLVVFMLALSAGTTQLGYGQAIYGFDNYRSSILNAPVFDSAGVRLSGTNYVAVLYGGPSPDSLTLGLDYFVGAPMTPEPFTRLHFGQGGYFDGGIVAFWTVGCGQIGSLQVRAWDTRLGATYDEVAALGIGGYGASTVFETRAGCGIGLPTPPEPLIGLQSFSLVPEPSPLFLFALGLPLLVLFYRRRSKRVILWDNRSG